MRFKDAFRAQYYLASLEKEAASTSKAISLYSFFEKNVSHILDEFCSELSEELDQILLPTIVYEIHKAKNDNLLKGGTSFSRYTSFFIDQKLRVYNKFASKIINKYPFLFEMLDGIIKQSFSNLMSCLKRFNRDLNEIMQCFQIVECSIKKVNILCSSDRHRNQQSLLLVLSDNKKIIYKPVDLHPDQLFNQFVDKLELSKPYNLIKRCILPKKNYGWLEYIPTKNCHSIEEVKNFYQRMGVLLAISDTVNYSDGHCENILAHGSYPLLLDGETLFQNYAMPISERKSIISTHLIQKFLTKRKNSSKYSALQATETEKFHSLFTHALNDRTDDICVSYRGFTQEINHHRPFFNGDFHNSSEHIEEVVDGYCVAYDSISQKANQFLRMCFWWDEIARVYSRVVVRDTGAYFYLQRRIQQPEYCKSKKKAEGYLRSKLGDTPYTDYEIKDTLALNIPYFYQRPNEKDLYDGDDALTPIPFPIQL